MAAKLLAEWFWTDRWMGSSAFLLPMEARGVYREMLTQAWRREARLPNDHEAIQRAIGATKAEWKRSWPAVSKYWRVDGGDLVNDTQLEVYEDAQGIAKRASERGLKGAHARAQALAQALAQAPTQAVPEIEPPSPSPVYTHTAREAGSSIVARGAHRSHAVCGVVCVPASAWEGMLAKLGGNADRLSGWIGGVMTLWQAKVNAGEAVPDGDDFAFWRHRWAESFGTTKPAETRKDDPARVVPDSAATKLYLSDMRAGKAS